MSPHLRSRSSSLLPPGLCKDTLAERSSLEQKQQQRQLPPELHCNNIVHFGGWMKKKKKKTTWRWGSQQCLSWAFNLTDDDFWRLLLLWDANKFSTFPTTPVAIYFCGNSSASVRRRRRRSDHERRDEGRKGKARRWHILELTYQLFNNWEVHSTSSSLSLSCMHQTLSLNACGLGNGIDPPWKMRLDNEETRRINRKWINGD